MQIPIPTPAKRAIISARKGMRRFWRRRVKETYPWYTSRLWAAQLLNASLRRKAAPLPPRPFPPCKRALIIYSKQHFDPQADSPSRPHSQSSAAHNARNIFHALEGIERIYVDQHEPIRSVSSPDCIIGILSPSFLSYARMFPRARRILFLVNAHPLYRFKALLQESKEIGQIFPFGEYLSPFLFLRAQPHTHHFLLIGNEWVKSTYLSFGVPSGRISLLQSPTRLDYLSRKRSPSRAGTLSVIYPASDIGIRKGFFRVRELWKEACRKLDPSRITLTIIGGDAGFSEDIQAFARSYPNVSFQGWVDSSSPEYERLLLSHDVCIQLSVEEGQVGTVLEGMACGCIPLITEQCGIPLAHAREGFIIDRTDKEGGIRALHRLLNDTEKREEISKNARAYIARSHTPQQFQNSIRNTILS